MNKTLTYAVVGCGSFGNEHTNALTLIQGAEITAFCDKHIEQAEKLKEKYNLENAICFADYNEMLSKMKFDVVVVATSDKEHCEIAIAAMKAGSHVMCEKPMAKTYKEAQAAGQILNYVCILPIFMSYLEFTVTTTYYFIPILNEDEILEMLGED